MSVLLTPSVLFVPCGLPKKDIEMYHDLLAELARNHRVPLPCFAVLPGPFGQGSNHVRKLRAIVDGAVGRYSHVIVPINLRAFRTVQPKVLRPAIVVARPKVGWTGLARASCDALVRVAA